jgi:hypothetical protein
MPGKVYVKPPPVVRSQFVVLIVIYVLFLAVGPVFLITAEGEARPFVAIFSLIWSAGCIALIIHAVKALRLIKNGPIEIAEVSGMAGEHESDFAARLRDLEKLKSDGIISGQEYQKKRSEMLQEKW